MTKMIMIQYISSINDIDVKLKMLLNGVKNISIPKIIIPKIQIFSFELLNIFFPITGSLIFLQEYAKHNSRSIKHRKAVVPATSGPEICKFKK